MCLADVTLEKRWPNLCYPWFVVVDLSQGNFPVYHQIEFLCTYINNNKSFNGNKNNDDD